MEAEYANGILDVISNILVVWLDFCFEMCFFSHNCRILLAHTCRITKIVVNAITDRFPNHSEHPS